MPKHELARGKFPKRYDAKDKEAKEKEKHTKNKEYQGKSQKGIEEETLSEYSSNEEEEEEILYSQGLPLKQFFGIKYRLVKVEHFEKYMKALGINMVMRKVGNKVLPTLLQLDHNDEQYTLLSSSLFLHFELKFKLNEEINISTPTGHQCYLTFQFKFPNQLVEIQTKPHYNVTVREFTHEEAIMTLVYNNVTCKMTYVNAAYLSNVRSNVTLLAGPPASYEEKLKS